MSENMTTIDGTNVDSSPAIHSEKSRTAYQWLAFFLGALGVHNFYAGRKKTAIAQLCLTVMQAMACAARGKSFVAIAAIWAMVEIFAVKKDGGGLPFAPRAKKSDGGGSDTVVGCVAACLLILLVGSCISYICSDEKEDAPTSLGAASKGNGVPYCKDESHEPIHSVCIGYLKPEKDVVYHFGGLPLVVNQVVKKDGDVGYYLCGLSHSLGLYDYGEDRNILIVSAADLADGDKVGFDSGRYFLCQGTWTYEAAFGGNRTVYVFLQIKDNELAEKMLEEVRERKKAAGHDGRNKPLD